MQVGLPQYPPFPGTWHIPNLPSREWYTPSAESYRGELSWPDALLGIGGGIGQQENNTIWSPFGQFIPGRQQGNARIH